MCTDCPYIIDGVAVKEEMCEDCMPEQKSLKQKSKKKKSTKITRRESYRRHLKKNFVKTIVPIQFGFIIPIEQKRIMGFMSIRVMVGLTM